MRRFSLSILLSLLFFIISASATSPSPGEAAAQSLANNDPVYLKLRNVKIGSETIKVKDFILKKDAGTFTFHSGAFYLLEPVEGKITGAVFLGEASFTLKAPIEVERRNLSLLTHGQPFEEQFSSAVFRFTDKTEDEIRKASDADAPAPSGDPAGLLSDVRQQLKKKLHDNLSARLLEDVMSSQAGGKFTAFIKGKKYSDKIVYDIDPHGSYLVHPEEVSLLLWDDSHAGVWAGFHLVSEYAAHTANDDEDHQTVQLDHETLDVTIDKSAHLEGTAKITFAARQDGVRVVPLDLFSTLRVESVSSADEQPLAFIQEDKKEDADFAIILPRELKKGENFTITTKYGGKDAISNEGGGNYYPVARADWYPAIFGSYATYDMTFRIPKGMTMVSTGTLLKSTDEGNGNITQWRTNIPQEKVGFNFGKFKRDEGKTLKQAFALETYANPNPPDFVQGIQHSNEVLGTLLEGSGRGHLIGLDALGSMSTLGMMKKAMAEAQLAMEIYTDFFGEIPYKHLALTQQTASGFGESFPELVYLPISYFFDSTVRHQLGLEDQYGYFTVVGPHEISHQWWGHMVGMSSYRDQWVSEGFADFSASLFLQYIYGQKNLGAYHKFWADQRVLMSQKNKEGKRPIDVGPLTMGYRLDTAKAGFNISQDLIYPKGSYILQMVRFMMQQRQGDPDAPFKELMHDFTKTYENRFASTEDFKAILEKHMTPEMDVDGNRKMDWFFNEYVYGTAYPSYKFEHSFSKDGNGDVVLNFKLTQADVNKNFVMLMPIYLELANGRVVRLGSARITGNDSLEQHVPITGLKDQPRNAMIAYYDDVLGNIESR